MRIAPLAVLMVIISIYVVALAPVLPDLSDATIIETPDDAASENTEITAGDVSTLRWATSAVIGTLISLVSGRWVHDLAGYALDRRLELVP